jgi:glucosylceramidase
MYKATYFIRLFFVGYLVSLFCSGCGQKEVTPSPSPIPTKEGVIKVFTTTPDKTKLLKEETKINFTSSTVVNPIIEIDSTLSYQTMEGWGAAITGSAANVLNGMSNTTRAALLKELFAADGLNLNSLRISIGASDFSLYYYSYDDITPGMEDLTLSHFDLGEDLQDVIPLLQEIIAINPSVKITASPWSAPGWMKTTGTMIGGSLKPQYYSVYASYFVKYIQAMQAKGITISAVTPQNEPLYFTQSYPGMSMTALEQIDFIKNHLGPAFQTAGIAAKIIAFDHNWEDYQYPIAVLDDPIVKGFISGSAFHGYNAVVVEKMSLVHDKHQDKDIYFTEIANGTWAPNFNDNLKFNLKNIIIGNARNWSRNVIYWNLALNQNGGPLFNGPNSNNRGVITLNNNVVERGVQYYALAHVAKFAKPGCKRIASTDLSAQELDNVCFLNQDGTKVLVVFNNATSSKKITVKIGNRLFEYPIEGGTATTFNFN